MWGVCRVEVFQSSGFDGLAEAAKNIREASIFYYIRWVVSIYLNKLGIVSRKPSLYIFLLDH
jgi:hypothetical protein